MKRYNIEGGLNETLDIEESPNGFWVEWNDVQELIQTLKEARLVVDGVCDEYKGYLVTLRKIDKVLNSIEGQG